VRVKLSRSVSVTPQLDEAVRGYAYQERLTLSEVYNKALSSYAPLAALLSPQPTQDIASSD
jgi:hypothetical protein